MSRRACAIVRRGSGRWRQHEEIDLSNIQVEDRRAAGVKL
jgi:hypothetical protein